MHLVLPSPKRFKKLLSWRYFWPLLVTGVLLSTGTISALYAHSDRYQTAIKTPLPPQIIVVKKKAAEPAQPPATPPPAAEQTPASTPAATSANSGTATTTTRKALPNSTPENVACNDKLNNIYFNYNMSLSAENQHHKDEIEDIQTAYDYGVYDQAAEQINDSTTPEQLRDQDFTEENARYSAATSKLTTDQQSQMHATGCFGL